jgi:integrase
MMSEGRQDARDAFVDRDTASRFLNISGRHGIYLNPRSFQAPHWRETRLPKSIRLYDLRHMCASLLLPANEHPKIVSQRLGHARVMLTLDTYSHVLPTMQEAASEKLERILGGGIQ